ncbi:conserved hypothetical protein [Ricinus communis]|uniref:DUF674 domain-containing protein n=1 Tax=Ricinus communis TaxID=3988 RepID=B9T150_RICCO|nr:conserved hypothetical protein [Ricinus communis]
MATTKVSLKLLVDTKNNKVLFAEAGKDYVDFLFNLLSLPLGTVIKLLEKHTMVGCLGNLYQSIEDLSESYLQPDLDKDSILNPKAPLSVTEAPLLICDDDESLIGNIYMCPSYHSYVVHDPKLSCLQCRRKMTNEVPFVDPVPTGQESFDEAGFVKGVVTYMVMDNLEVKPMSTISSITLLNKFNI